MSQTLSPSIQILITGGNGFLGRHLTAELEAAGYTEIATPTSRDYDLRNVDAVRGVLHDIKPDVVIHAAAVVGGIGANQAHPGRFFYENAVMGINLLEESRRAEVQKFVTVGTVCSYPKFAPTPFNEADLWDGYPEETNAPYGLAKKMLLVQGQAYREEYGFNSIFLLPANLFGPHDNFDPASSHVVPALIRKIAQAKKAGDETVPCWGTGDATREFLYATDAARGIRLATESYDDPAPVNLGTGVEVSIRELAETLVDVMGYEGTLTWNPSMPDGQPRRVLNTQRAQDGFGFSSEIRLREGLERTVAWFDAQGE